MKKVSLIDRLNFRKIGVTALVSFAACMIFGANAYPMVASAEEEKPENAVTIDVTVKQTQDVYSIEIVKENDEYVLSCDSDESFVYSVSEENGVTTMECSGLLEQDEWTYEMTYVVSETFEEEKSEGAISVTKGSDVVDVKIVIPDSTIMDDFNATWELAKEMLLPKIFLIVAGILFVALVIFGFAMLCIAL